MAHSGEIDTSNVKALTVSGVRLVTECGLVSACPVVLKHDIKMQHAMRLVKTSPLYGSDGLN